MPVVACADDRESAGTTPVVTPGPSPGPGEGATISPTDGGGGESGAGENGADSAPPPRPEGDGPGPATSAPGGGSTDIAVDDQGALGRAGTALLRPSVPEAVVEVDRSPGAELEVDPRALVARELRAHGGKRAVTGSGDSEVTTSAVVTAGDLRQLAAERATRSEPGRVAVYILVLEGRFEDENVTGVAFAATSFAIFPEQIAGGVLGIDRPAFEEAVIVHELGHLFGLVDLTGHGAFHEDPEHPGHSVSQASVMYWAVEDLSVANLFRGGPPRTFDAADRQEMDGIRG